MLTRFEVNELIGSCENYAERLVILAFAELGLTALEICNLSIFNIYGRWFVVEDIRNNKRGFLLSGNIEKLLFFLPRMPKNPREIKEMVLRVAERTGIYATPTDLRRFSSNFSSNRRL